MSNLKKYPYQDLFRACFGQHKMHAIIQQKVHWLRKLLPVERIVDVGGMWNCNGFYSFLCAAEGAKEVLILDLYASERFNKIKEKFPNVGYLEVDFYNSMVDGQLKEMGASYPADALICYDVLLHQPEPIHFITNIINSFSAKRAILGNPVIKRSAGRNDLFFVPFSRKFKPLGGDIRRSTNIHNHEGWVWAFSHGFLLSCIRYLGFRLAEQKLIRNWGRKLDYSLIMVEAK